MNRLTIGRVLATLSFVLAANPAFAVTRWVNDDDPNGGFYVPPGTSCNNPGYPTIQDAVNAAVPGDIINVCPGTYPEQVFVVGPGKNNLTLRSVDPLQATIQAPPVMMEPGDLVTIDNSQNMTLRDFFITGPLPDTLFCSLNLRSGVRVKGGGSALILGNRITEMRAMNPALRGCQNGFAIAVGRRFDPSGPQVGSAVIVRNVLDRYQKGGIYVDNAGSHADIRENLVFGEGPVNYIAQNGIQVSREATGQVRNNSVRDHAYTLPTFTASGMILFEAGRIVVDRNQLNRNQDGVGLYTMVGVATISSNRIIGGLAASPNPFGDGIYAGADTASNVIRGNFLRDNVEHDCHDDSTGPNNPPALVANFWINNDGLTENKLGLCKPDDDGEEEDDDDFDEDGERDDEDEDDDNDGEGDGEDEDDDNDGERDGEDEDDDNDNIGDEDDDESTRQRQRSSAGTVGPGEHTDFTTTADASTLLLTGRVEAPDAEFLRVEIYDPAGLLVGVSPPALGGASIKVPVALPGTYTVRVRNVSITPVDYIVRVIRTVPW